MSIYNFSKVKMTAHKMVDGKRKQKTFYQTINPFNRNEDGSVKTRREIDLELNEDIKQWKTEQ